MKNKLINKIVLLTLCSIIGVALTGCDTDVEPVAFGDNKIEDLNPELYQEYLKNLRKYRDSEHKVVYAWFDNQTKTPSSRGEHITSLPDSIDYVVLMYPDNLADWELNDIQKVREKGMKVLVEFDFDASKALYDEQLVEMTNNEQDISELPSYLDVLVDTMDYTFKTIEKFNYDGLVIGYKGKSLVHMTEAEKTEFMAYQKAFIGVTSIWKENNPEKLIAFSGKPQHVIDKSVLSSYTHIILQTSSALNSSEVMYEVSMSFVDNVPSDRFILTAESLPTDKEDTKTGLWLDGSQAVPGVADCVASSYEDFNIAGIGIYKADRDYHNPTSAFHAIKNAIQIINPSLK